MRPDIGGTTDEKSTQKVVKILNIEILYCSGNEKIRVMQRTTVFEIFFNQDLVLIDN